ncbi:HNH endonuclease [Tomitella biformata]|uniref:HNH endonuclease n=1 Tax=Tomitella biformata TaxID=630403 RepID=UPI0022854EF8|nr:HNH endonuclease signature motif containing protein [Tomitella biformata]
MCHLCGKPGATTADHVQPRSLGGGDGLDNLRPAHKACNSSRGNRPAVSAAPPSRDWLGL